MAAPRRSPSCGEEDLDDLLPLHARPTATSTRSRPTDEALLALCRALIADPEREGVQLIARDGAAAAVGFATVYWTWQTLSGARLAVMNDLFVRRDARGTGLADALIAACAERGREHGATTLAWQTAKDNHRAQAVYDRVGGRPLGVAGLRAGGRSRELHPMKVIRPGGDREGRAGSSAAPRSPARRPAPTATSTWGSSGCPPARARGRTSTPTARARATCSAGRCAIRWGDRLEQTVELGPGDMVYVPPHETHVLENLSDTEAAEYVVARDSPTEDAVEVPWATR